MSSWNKMFFIFFFIIFLLAERTVPISSHKSVNFWDETEPFGQAGKPSPDLRLPTEITPSFYRLKLKADLDNSNFTGEVAITLRASKQTKQIILHSKDLIINPSAKLTEQIYEKLELRRSKRESDTVPSNSTDSTANPTVTEAAPATTSTLETTETVTTNKTVTTNTPEPTNITSTTAPPIIKPVETQVTHSAARSVKILNIIPGAGDRLIIVLGSILKTNVDYILELTFEGIIKESLNGFYKSSYKTKDGVEKILATTQFEPTSARAAFPCFDEPAFKAKFEISIAHVKDITAISNMKVAAIEPIPEEPNWQWTHFERSVKMSTYLVAYVLSDFTSIETTYLSKDNVNKTIRISARPELIDRAKYALNITPKLVDYFEDVFGVPYALDKLDLIAIPDYSNVAMENWGLITFRETGLLYDENEGVPRDKQSVGITLAHELAHQWFGNLVTMRWWTDLWLNEGFATYIEYVGLDFIEPQWNVFEMFANDKMNLLRTDALKNTSPVSRQVIDASEISQKFDEISYAKGAALIRMLNCTITETLFHKGLHIYLNRWKYSNAEENNLWEAMSEAIAAEPSLKDLSIVDFMNSWTRQAGYPVVNVIRNYDTGAVEIEQRLFTTTKEPYQAMVDQLWQIPVTYRAVGGAAGAVGGAAGAVGGAAGAGAGAAGAVAGATGAGAGERAGHVWLNARTAVVHTGYNSTTPLHVNVDAIGYYRVNYDKKNWELLSSAMKSGAIKSPVTRAQLIDDAFNLAKTSQLNYTYALGLTTSLIDGEDSKTVWDLVLNNMQFLRYNLRAVPGYVYFKDYMNRLMKKQLETLNYGLDPPKDDNTALLIENLVTWECNLHSTRCINWAKAKFDEWAAQPDYANKPITSYLNSVIYSTALKTGGRREFDILWTAFLNSTNPTFKSIVINTLPSTTDESLIVTLLEKSLGNSTIPTQYALGPWSVEPPIGSKIAQDFFIQNFDAIYKRFTALETTLFSAVLNSAFGFITTKDELDRLKSFALEHKDKLIPMSQMLQKLVDTANLRIDWVKKHARDINTWFEDFVTGKTSSDVSTTEAPSTPTTTTAPNSTPEAPTTVKPPTVNATSR